MRRYFYKALASDPERAKVALAHIGALFRIERSIADAPRKKKEQVRRVDKFFDWCDAEAPLVLDETPMAAGLTYASNQRIALRRFLDDGRLPVHNNISELNLRRQASGAETGFSSAVMMAGSPTRASSGCSPALGSTTSSRSATCATCCVFSRAGPTPVARI